MPKPQVIAQPVDNLAQAQMQHFQCWLNLCAVFDPRKDEIELYIMDFERNARQWEVPCSEWISYVQALVPTELKQTITRTLAELFDEDIDRYEHIKGILLEKFCLTAERYCHKILTTDMSPSLDWDELYLELYFDSWVKAMDVNTFTELWNLIITTKLSLKSRSK